MNTRKTSKLLALLLALVMVVGLMPTTAFAYTEGNIAGTTGNGATEATPVICDNFDELKAAMENTEITYVQLNSTRYGSIPKSTILDFAIRVKGNKVLMMNGDSSFSSTMNSAIDSLFWVGTTHSLTINGSGSLKFDATLTNGTNAIVRVEGGTLTVNDPNVTLNGGIQTSVYGRAIVAYGGTINISAGTFTGKTVSSKSSNYNAVLFSGNTTANISGGTFTYTKTMESLQTPYSLCINDTSTTVNISGGTFQGIQLLDGKALNDYLVSGYTYTTDTDTGMTEIKLSPIITVDLTVETPTPGGMPSDMTFSAPGLNTGTRWWYSGLGAITSMDYTTAFVDGQSYSAIYTLIAPSGKTFATEDALNVAVTGGDKVSVFRKSDTEIQVTVNFSSIAADTSIIDNVDLTVETPTPGGMPSDMTFSAPGLNTGTRWWYSGLGAITSMTNTTAFVDGQSYSAIYALTAPTGKTFAAEDALNVAVTGGDKVSVFRKSDTEIQVTVNFSSVAADTSVIDNVDLTVETPAVGELPNDMTFSAPGLNNGARWWYRGLGALSVNAMNSTDTFIHGQEYSAIYRLTTPTGKTFAEENALTVNVAGGEKVSVFRKSDTEIEVTVNFPTSGATEISSVSATVTPPTAGGHPASPTAGANTSLVSYSWSEKSVDVLIKSLTSANTFEAGKTYRLSILLRAATKYIFKDEATTATINSNTATIEIPGTTLIRFYRDFTVPAGVTGYTLTVANGTGEGSYAKDDIGTVTANAPESGYRFKEWIGLGSTIVFTEGNKATTTAKFKMPADALDIRATYELIPVTEHNITVTNGKATIGASTLTTKTTDGTVVTLTVNVPASGKRFKNWTITSGGVTLANSTSATTTFTMGTTDVAITANYETLKTGWVQIGTTWYYYKADEGGKAATGWEKISGAWYLFATDGKMLTGWQKSGGAWYLLASSGKMLTGWQKSGTSWYYLASRGQMQTGWQKIGASWYYFHGSGIMATSQWIGKDYVNTKGVWSKSR